MPADIPASAWSETAASNTSAAPDGWPSNSAPTIVYSTDREMMGAIKREWNRNNPTATSSGTNTVTLTYTTAPAAYVQGMRFSFIVGTTNTGAATLNVNGLGAKNIFMDGAALVGGEMVASSVVETVYDGTQFQIISSRAITSQTADNILDNPDFDLWQRGAGDSSNIGVLASTNTYGPDRWYFATGANQAGGMNTAAAIVTGSKQSAVVIRNNGQTGTGALIFAQALTTDQVIAMRGKIVSASMWLAAGSGFTPSSGTVTMKLYVGTGTEGKRGGGFTSETNVLTGAVNLTPGGSAAQVFATGASAVPSNATQGQLQIAWTPVGTAGANDYVAVQRAMLFVGNQNLAFRRTVFAEVLARCQRFYWKTFAYGTAPAQSAGNTGPFCFPQTVGAGTSIGVYSCILPTRMRTGGAGTSYNTAASNAQIRNTSVSADCSSTTLQVDENQVQITATSAAGSAAGNVNRVHLTVDADL